ncbi:hypothetical protein PANDA_004241, partial [Ailuropoda melanoleuca]
KHKINKETTVLNDTLEQMNLTDVFRTFHPKRAEYTFFPRANGTLSKKDHILAHKTTLSKFKNIKVIQCIVSDKSPMKLKVNHKKKFRKTKNTWRLSNMLLNN